MNERNLLQKFDCPFIVKLFGTFQTTHELFYVLRLRECLDKSVIMCYNKGSPDKCGYIFLCYFTSVTNLRLHKNFRRI